MRYRKKPVVIEAVQWTVPPTPEMGIFWPKHEANMMWEVVGDSLFINTLEGRMEAKPGDWIIKGVQGEYYPCKQDIFEATYEAVGKGQ